MPRYDDAIARIDAANADDPNTVVVDGASRPAEVVYSQRMSETLAQLYPHASEELKLAARAQHIRRWTIPRDSYPMDRPGYLRWRNELKARHAFLAADILAKSGYEQPAIERVGALIRKHNLKNDAEAQALEDVVCIVFLEHYADAFIAKHDDAKVVDILRKTWGKMSEHGHAAALELKHSDRVGRLIGAALDGK